MCKILGLFVNTLTTDEKYSLLNRDNLTEPNQMRHLRKQILSQFVCPFSKSRWNFECFEQKDDPQSLCIFEITDCQKRG